MSGWRGLCAPLLAIMHASYLLCGGRITGCSSSAAILVQHSLDVTRSPRLPEHALALAEVRQHAALLPAAVQLVCVREGGDEGHHTLHSTASCESRLSHLL